MYPTPVNNGISTANLNMVSWTRVSEPNKQYLSHQLGGSTPRNIRGPRVLWLWPFQAITLGCINPSKTTWDLTNGPLSKLLELLDTQFYGSGSVAPVGDFLESNLFCDDLMIFVLSNCENHRLFVRILSFCCETYPGFFWVESPYVLLEQKYVKKGETQY